MAERPRKAGSGWLIGLLAGLGTVVLLLVLGIFFLLSSVSIVGVYEDVDTTLRLQFKSDGTVIYHLLGGQTVTGRFKQEGGSTLQLSGANPGFAFGEPSWDAYRIERDGEIVRLIPQGRGSRFVLRKIKE